MNKKQAKGRGKKERRKEKKDNEASRDGKGQGTHDIIENNNGDTAFPGLLQS